MSCVPSSSQLVKPKLNFKIFSLLVKKTDKNSCGQLSSCCQKINQGISVKGLNPLFCVQKVESKLVINLQLFGKKTAADNYLAFVKKLPQ